MGKNGEWENGKRADGIRYAMEGNIKIRVQAENAKMTLALRIPGWCKIIKFPE